MKRPLTTVVLCSLIIAGSTIKIASANDAEEDSSRQARPASTSADDNHSDAGFHAGARALNPSQRSGREIWYKATAGNDRFHTYVFQQRLGVLIDWYRVLNADDRGERFNIWGLINDPGCCTPGTAGCPAKSKQETYGFDWCPGDAELLEFVGRDGYRDPACDFEDAPVTEDHAHGPGDQRQSSCGLAFGTSTGALGLRKFPNPRFDEQRWRELNAGTPGGWAGYNKRLSNDRQVSDSRVSHLSDGSIEPPFLIGMACGACHIAFNPLKPPQDPNHPAWENILGAIGNQYTRMSEIMASGMPADSVEWQLFSHARPGTVDTSAVPNDQVNNPGTMNALINVHQRPTFDGEVVVKWRPVNACDGNDERGCWCEPGRENKCWQHGEQTETVHHILKDGSDSIGALEALQRVYINIGSCAEACWVNHLTDFFQLDPQQRGYGQTPVDIGQCRRDCPNFRAIEDRLQNVMDFLLSPEAASTPLHAARGLEDRGDLVEQLEGEFGAGSVADGRDIFAANCARCHSSQSAPFDSVDFHARAADRDIRRDWLGNEKSTRASEVGTFRCRALHSNHMQGHIWQEYASETYRARAADENLPDDSGGGRGYYRNLSLLDLWAHAPFMHNNAVGPELCGQPSDPAKEFYRSPYPEDRNPTCVKYDPSVEGRYALFKSSVDSLLNPAGRIPKVTRQDQSVRYDIGPKLWDGEAEKKLAGVVLEVPAGAPAGVFGGFQYKEMVGDLVLTRADRDLLEQRVTERVGAETAPALIETLDGLARQAVVDPEQLLAAAEKNLPLLMQAYSNCTADVENAGHRFGEDLPPQDKRALTAFLATL